MVDERFISWNKEMNRVDGMKNYLETVSPFYEPGNKALAY